MLFRCPQSQTNNVPFSPHSAPFPSPPLPSLHFSSHQLCSSPFLLCCGSCDRGIPSLLTRRWDSAPRWRQCIPTAWLNSHSSQPRAVFTRRSHWTRSMEHPSGWILTYCYSGCCCTRQQGSKVPSLPSSSFFLLAPHSPPSSSKKAPPLWLRNSGLLLLEKWGGGDKINKKESFLKTPGLPSKHSHVKWQLPQPIPFLSGKREVQSTKGGSHHPTIHPVPHSHCTPPAVPDSSFIVSTAVSTAATNDN